MPSLEKDDEVTEVAITMLSGAAICTVRLQWTDDGDCMHASIKAAVCRELHLPEGCFEILSTGRLASIIFNREWGRWSDLFEDACKHGDDICALNVMRALDDGARIFNFRPLHLAIFHKCPKIVKALLENGADPNTKTVHDDTHDTQKDALHVAASRGDLETMQILLAASADVNAETSDGDRPLHFAACRGDPNFVRVLLDAKADIRAENMMEETALDNADMCGNADVISTLKTHSGKYSCEAGLRNDI